MTIAILAATVALASGTVSCASAAAEALKILPEASTSSPITVSTTEGEDDIEALGGTKVECKDGAGKVSITSASLGTFASLFEGCKSTSASTCTGSGLPSGDVRLEGTYDYWLAKAGTESLPASVYLVNEAQFKCKGIEESSDSVKGCLAGKVTPLEVSAEFTLTTLSGSKGVNEITKVLPLGSSKEAECKLELATSAEKFERASDTVNQVAGGFEQGGKEIEIALMCGGCKKKAVIAKPRKLEFGDINVHTTSMAQGVVYENTAAPNWEPTGDYTLVRILGANGGFQVADGLPACDKPIEMGQNCEFLWHFEPTIEERYLFIAEAVPGGEPIELEGRGV